MPVLAGAGPKLTLVVSALSEAAFLDISEVGSRLYSHLGNRLSICGWVIIFADAGSRTSVIGGVKIYARRFAVQRKKHDECAAFMLWPVRLACAWGWLRRCVLRLAEQIGASPAFMGHQWKDHGRPIWIWSSMGDIGGCAGKLTKRITSKINNNIQTNISAQ
jgi:hypothetical protein